MRDPPVTGHALADLGLPRFVGGDVLVDDPGEQIGRLGHLGIVDVGRLDEQGLPRRRQPR